MHHLRYRGFSALCCLCLRVIHEKSYSNVANSIAWNASLYYAIGMLVGFHVSSCEYVEMMTDKRKRRTSDMVDQRFSQRSQSSLFVPRRLNANHETHQTDDANKRMFILDGLSKDAHEPRVTLGYCGLNMTEILEKFMIVANMIAYQIAVRLHGWPT